MREVSLVKEEGEFRFELVEIKEKMFSEPLGTQGLQTQQRGLEGSGQRPRLTVEAIERNISQRHEQ